MAETKKIDISNQVKLAAEVAGLLNIVGNLQEHLHIMAKTVGTQNKVIRSLQGRLTILEEYVKSKDAVKQ